MLIVGVVVTIIVVTAGMVSTTWVQFIKGGLLVVFCLLLTVLILRRGFEVPTHLPVTPLAPDVIERQGRVVVDPDWPSDAWLQVQLPSGAIRSYRRLPDGLARLTQVVTTGRGPVLVDGLPQGTGANAARPRAGRRRHGAARRRDGPRARSVRSSSCARSTPARSRSGPPNGAC